MYILGSSARSARALCPCGDPQALVGPHGPLWAPWGFVGPLGICGFRYALVGRAFEASLGSCERPGPLWAGPLWAGPWWAWWVYVGGARRMGGTRSPIAPRAQHGAYIFNIFPKLGLGFLLVFYRIR